MRQGEVRHTRSLHNACMKRRCNTVFVLLRDGGSSGGNHTRTAAADTAVPTQQPPGHRGGPERGSRRQRRRVPVPPRAGRAEPRGQQRPGGVHHDRPAGSRAGAGAAGQGRAVVRPLLRVAVASARCRLGRRRRR